jgi:hypothetical protein
MIIVEFLIEILFELMVIKFLFFIPISKFSFGGKSICYIVVMHDI